MISIHTICQNRMSMDINIEVQVHILQIWDKPWENAHNTQQLYRNIPISHSSLKIFALKLPIPEIQVGVEKISQ